MATKIHMEALSPTMEEGQIVRWLKSEGEEISNGDILAEVETDKATMELVARGDGVLRSVFLGEGETAPVGEVIGIIAAEDEDISGMVPDGASDGGGSSGTEEAESSGPDDDASETPSEREADASQEPGGNGSPDPDGPDAAGGKDGTPGSSSRGDSASEGRVKASPLARRLAEEAGIDLGSIDGSGPGGRVVKKDVEEARAAPPASEGRSRDSVTPATDTRPTRPAPEPWSDAGAEEGVEEVRVSQMRKTIAKRLVESLSPVPHFFLTVDVDMGRVLESRSSINEMVKADGDRISVNDFVLKATAVALRKHPECNAAWHGDHIKRFSHVHLGVAVAVDDGLITPVVKHAHRKGLVQISREVREMAGRAREKKLQPDEYTGSTFSISNLGMFGIHEFTAIINPPEAGILAVGTVQEVPVAVDGEVEIRPRMRVTMSCDHRVIDGAQGSRFLASLRQMLEEPAAILL